MVLQKIWLYLFLCIYHIGNALQIHIGYVDSHLFQKNRTGTFSTFSSKYNSVEQLQKRYMVSGSLYPLISFLDVSYLVSFAVTTDKRERKQGPEANDATLG